MIKTDCPDCGGSGYEDHFNKITLPKCKLCQGSGKLYREETDLDVPDGVEFVIVEEFNSGKWVKQDEYFVRSSGHTIKLPHKVGDKSVCSVCGGVETPEQMKYINWKCPSCLGKPKTVVKVEVEGNKLITWWRE